MIRAASFAVLAAALLLLLAGQIRAAARTLPEGWACVRDDAAGVIFCVRPNATPPAKPTLRRTRPTPVEKEA